MVFVPKDSYSRIGRPPCAQQYVGVSQGWYHNEYGYALKLYKHHSRGKVSW